MNHSLQRHRRLYSLFRETGTEKYRHDLVFSFANGRTENSADLTDLEAQALIKHLEEQLGPGAVGSHTKSQTIFEGQKMRRRILSLCYTMGLTTWNKDKSKSEVDFERLNSWMKHYSYLHKPLNDYSYKELQRLVKQFEHVAKETLSQPHES